MAKKRNNDDHNPDDEELTEFRSIDGSGNNLADPTLNAAGTPMVRIGDAHFDPDGSPLAHLNSRVVSNQVVGQGDADIPNQDGLSEFIFSWGQFLDHDLDLLRSGTVPLPIVIPPDDPFFPPGTEFPLARSITDSDGFAINNITGWIDGSMVYGSTQAVADSLRLPDGHMLTSDGDNLPIDAAGRMLAGDTRVQENPGLTSLHTLFVREHNFQVDLLAELHPTWTGEQLYQNARVIVGAEIANITYSEFLPELLGKKHGVDEYRGYDPSVDPTISEEFAGAAYRFGHSTVANDASRIDNDGNLQGPEIALKDLFGFPATDFNAFGGADGFLRNMAESPALAFDARIVDGLRNFLGEGRGQDLAAVNIERGFDLGLGTLNETREALGMKPYKSFEQLTDDPGTLAALKETFADVDEVGLWIGGLSEKHVKDGLLGSTFAEILGNQFEDLRDGDRFYFENVLSENAIKEIKATSLSDIIERNTDTGLVQDDVFIFADRHTSDVAAENPNAPQIIIGVQEAPTLVGGKADDTLVASVGGVNTMTGGGGRDTFHFDASLQQSAVITDFKHGDIIEIENIPGLDDTFKDLDISSSRGDTTIEVGLLQITMLNHHAHASDFLFDV